MCSRKEGGSEVPSGSSVGEHGAPSVSHCDEH